MVWYDFLQVFVCLSIGVFFAEFLKKESNYGNYFDKVFYMGSGVLGCWFLNYVTD